MRETHVMYTVYTDGWEGNHPKYTIFRVAIYLQMSPQIYFTGDLSQNQRTNVRFSNEYVFKPLPEHAPKHGNIWSSVYCLSYS